MRFGPQAARGTEEDAALSAIDDFCNGLAEHKFDYVDNRDVLWRTLAKITERMAMQRVRSGRWKEVSIEDLLPGSSFGDNRGGRLAFVEPTSEYKAIVEMIMTELIEKLENPLWRQAVLLRLEDYSVAEIAARLGKSRATVFVWFRAIRKSWEEHLEGCELLD